jgi:hypothetical protein
MNVLQQQSTSATCHLLMIDVPAAATGTRHSTPWRRVVQLGCALANEKVAKVNANAITMVLAMGMSPAFSHATKLCSGSEGKMGRVRLL